MAFELERFIKEINQGYKTLTMEAMEPYLTALLSRASGESGGDGVGFAALLNELGGYYRGVSQYEKAEVAFLRAEEIIRRAAGTNNADYATTINNLAGVYRLTGNLSQSEQLFLQAIEIYTSCGYGESYVYASTLNNLGLLYLDRKEYGKAAVRFEEACQKAKRENSHPVVSATGLSNLAGAYLGLGRRADAERMLLDSVQLYHVNHLEHNVHYGSAVNGLGLFYFSGGDYDRAEWYFLEALKLRERDYGRKNHEFAKASDNLSALYEKTGKPDWAETYTLQAMAAYSEIFGEDSEPYRTGVATLERLRRVQKISVSEGFGSDSGRRIAALKSTGMELAFLSFAQFCATTLCRRYEAYSGRIAAGLVGEGSECYGFDDEISQDHDWGPSFCLWLTKKDYDAVGMDLQREYEKLTLDFYGMRMNTVGPESAARRGVLEIGEFYRKYIGLDRLPTSLKEWRAIPETHLSVVTNGKVFVDGLGEFSRFRDGLKKFYPEDIRLKKLAAQCAHMGQSGQYNYPRSVKRSEPVAANQALANFIDGATSAVYLLNREYKPFYKWMHRGLKGLPILGDELYGKLIELTADASGSGESVFDRKQRLIEEISLGVVRELVNQGLSSSSSDYLPDHARQVQDSIRDLEVRSLHLMAE
jgi:tetratricopeptide (TPR) repeat protein